MPVATSLPDESPAQAGQVEPEDPPGEDGESEGEEVDALGDSDTELKLAEKPAGGSSDTESEGFAELDDLDELDELDQDDSEEEEEEGAV